ncbi:hypothetical protein HPT27_01365 [Permianibacter sp. IMCC34836]|uniref:FG-GAP-like repeat-containing protein n=1 Tax=Permianibacter fluminis TaxID=2738515 RepID=UPI001551801B|nr:FG-GAP-like repeat-containing protein [Permianibacter fluminis]NQD35651.1 hypothetical protein [Permianibacter fluminis]
MPTAQKILRKSLPLLVSATLFATIMHASAADQVVGGGLYDIIVGDFDGDQMSDVIRQGLSGQQQHSSVLAAVQRAGIQRWQDGFLDTAWNRDAAHLAVGDFNGDASTDIIVQGNNPLALATVIQTYTDGRLGMPVQTIGSWYLGLQWDSAHHRLITADFNGDGRDDVFLQGTSNKDRHALALANEKGTFDRLAFDFDNNHLNRDWAINSTTLASGDFDGNGTYELFAQPSNGQDNALVISSDSRALLSTVQTTIPAQHLNLDWSSGRHRVVVGDFNGDGKDDVFLLAAHTVEQSAYLPSAGTQFDRVDRIIERIPNLEQLKQVLVGDFDADGIDDLILLFTDRDLVPMVLLADAGRASRLQGMLRKLGLLTRNQFLRYEEGNSQHFGSASSAIGAAQTGTAVMPKHSNAASANAVEKSMAPRRAAAKSATLGVDPAPTEYGGSGGSFRVSESGAATYSVAIATPPGSGGVSPKIGLSYSSQSGNGPVGMGWAITGTSAVSRCNATQETDGANLPLSFGTDAKYCLGGQRLIAANQSLAAQIGSCPSGSTALTYLVPEIYSGTVVTVCSRSGATLANPSSFVVTQRDGSTSYYGNFNGSFSDTTLELNERNSAGTVVATNKTMFWALARFMDSAGNYIDYRYQKNVLSGEHLIRTILFTGNDAAGYALTEANAPGRINFIYEARHDAREMYSYGSVTKVAKRLSYVESRGEVEQFRRYDLYYAPQNAAPVSQLEYIQECRESACLPAMKFSWLRINPDFSPYPQAAVPLSSRYRGGKPIDLNGDGVLDFAWLSEKTEHDRFYWQSYITRKDGSNYTMDYPDGGQPSIRADDAIEHDGNWYPFDFNGDGYQDVIYPSGKWRVLTATSTGAFSSTGIDTGVTIYNKQGVVFGDFTGDGLPDLLQVNSIGSALHLSPLQRVIGGTTPYKFGALQTITIPKFTTPSGLDGMPPDEMLCMSNKYLQTADVDGDGSLDIIATVHMRGLLGGTCPYLPRYVDPNCSLFCENLYISQKAAFLSRKLPDGSITFIYDEKYSIGYEMGTEESHAGDRGYVYFPDLNGDGITDVVGRAYTSTKVYQKLGTGAGYLPAQEITGLNNLLHLQFVDVNADGLTDILFPNSGHYQVKFQNADGTFADPVAMSASYGDLNDRENMVFDYTGDGRSDLLMVDCQGDYYHLQMHLFAGGHAPANVINKVETLGTNAVTSISYAPLSRLPAFESSYVRGQGANSWVKGNGSPFFDVTGPMFVVSNVWSDRILTYGNPGAGMISQVAKVSYKYGRLRAQAGGRGTLGFESVTTQDLSSYVTTTTEYEQVFPLTGMPKTTKRTKNNGVEISSARNTYATRPAALGGTIVYADWQVDEAKDLNGSLISVTATHVYPDDYGNGAVNWTIKNDDVLTDYLQGKRRVFSTSEFGSTVDSKFFGRLSATGVASDTNGVPMPSRSSAYEYYGVSDGAKRRLLKAEIVEPNGNEREYLRTYYEYDSFGNKTRSVTQSCHLARPTGNCAGTADASNPTFIERGATVEFDARGRFPVRKKNHFGQITEEILARDATYLPTRVKGATGIVTTTQYTTMGRAWRTSDTTGNWSENNVLRCSNAEPCLNGAAYRVDEISASGGRGIKHYDLLGRIVAEQVSSINEPAYGFITTLFEYNIVGRLVHTSWPYFSNLGSATQWEKTTYDLLGRVTEVRHANGSTNRKVYDKLLVTQTNELGQVRVEKYNAFGELDSVLDNAGNTVYYSYDGAGRLDTLSRVNKVGLNNGLQSDLDYDRLGRKTYMWDADKSPGIRGETGWRYEYNALGELTKQTDPRGYTSETKYDALGRSVSRIDKSNTGALLLNHVWVYNNTDSQSSLAGQLLSELDSVAGFSRTYTPDALGRPGVVTTRIDGVDYSERTEYDSIGRVAVQRDLTNKGLRYVRNMSGYVYEVQDADNSSIVFQRIEEMDAKGNVTQETLGNGARIKRSYYADTGLLERIETKRSGSSIQNLYYQWDGLGNLKRRTDTSLGKNLTEVFDYDVMNRLFSADARDGGTDASKLMTLTFDPAGEGNIQTKSDVVGSYTYENKESSCTQTAHVKPGPHAVSNAAGKSYCYDANGNQVAGNGRALTYANTFDLPTEIAGTNGHTTRYSYAISGARYKRTDTVGSDVTTTYFIGNVEIVKKAGTTEYRRAIPNGIVTNGNPSYILKDHLGSTDVILDCTGNTNTVQSFSFDAFGNQRQASSWSIRAGDFSSSLLSGMRLMSPRSDAKTFHGYTGHEMVDELGLIHMNGRMYDPKLGRFLQADPYIQAPKSSQSLNRYSYLLNNPLNGTDPTGFMSEWLRNPVRAMMRNWSPEHSQMFVSVASFMCGPAYYVCYGRGTYDNARAHGASRGDAMFAGVEAGITAYISAQMFNAIGDAFSGGKYGSSWWRADAAGKGAFGGNLSWTGYLAKVGAHGMAGGVMSYVQGGKFGDGFASAGVTEASAPLIEWGLGGNGLGYRAARTTVAAVIGGTASELTGGKFANGAVSAAFAWNFNHEEHRTMADELKYALMTMEAKGYNQEADMFREFLAKYSADFWDEGMVPDDWIEHFWTTFESGARESAQQRYSNIVNGLHSNPAEGFVADSIPVVGPLLGLYFDGNGMTELVGSVDAQRELLKIITQGTQYVNERGFESEFGHGYLHGRSAQGFDGDNPFMQ